MKFAAKDAKISLMRRTLLEIAWIALLLTPFVGADDWPQWRGLERNGQSAETGVLAAWPEGGAAKVLWRAQVGKGHSAASISGGRAYSMGWDGQNDSVFCFDALTGKEIWRQSYPCKTILQWPGPRATPTVSGGVVYTLGQHGQLRAWDAKDGTPRWSVDLSTSYQPDVDYGFPWSPLIEGELLLLGAGSRGLALRTRDGSAVWGADGKPGACASPVPFTKDGKRGIALVTMSEARDFTTLVGLDPQTGAVLWSSRAWPEKWGAVCNDLVVSNDSIFVSSAETFVKGARFRLNGGKVESAWETPKASSYTGNAVLLNNHLYFVTKAGALRCIEWESGKDAWSQTGFGTYGALIAADGKLFVQASQSGELAVVEANAAKYVELRRMQPFGEKGETFTAPALANGRLYCRSYLGEIVCLQTGASK